MKHKKTNNTMSYYSTLFQRYNVKDEVLASRTQKRAIGAVLEQLDKKEVKVSDFINKSKLKKLRRAFGKTKCFKGVATSLTFATALIFFQTSVLEANTPMLGISKIQQTFSIVNIDTDSSLQALNKQATTDDRFKTTSLHFMTNKVQFNDYKPLEINSVILDDDSDVVYTEHKDINVLTVIDTTIEDWKILAHGVKEGAVLLLEKEDDALDSMLSELKKLNRVESINIISHGSSGQLHFNNKYISSSTLKQNSKKWKELGTYLDKDGDILLYGCNVAKGEEGKKFIQTLATLTSADIGASLNPTGNLDKGGDWELEVAIGEVSRISNLSAVKEKFLSLLEIRTNLEDGTVYRSYANYQPLVIGDDVFTKIYLYDPIGGAYSYQYLKIDKNNVVTTQSAVTLVPASVTLGSVKRSILSNGNILFIWISLDSRNAYFKILASDFTEVVSSTQLTVTNNIDSQDGVELSNGNIVFLWRDTDARRHYIQRYSSSGTVIDTNPIDISALLSNIVSSSNLSIPTIASSSDGTFMVLLNDTDIYNGVLYSNEDAEPTSLITIANVGDQNTESSEIVELSNGKYLVVYVQNNTGVFFKIYNSNGTVAVESILLPGESSNNNVAGIFTYDGGFIIDYKINGGTNLLTEQYNNDGSSVTSDVFSSVNLNSTSGFIRPFIDYDGKVSFLVTDIEAGETTQDTWLIRDGFTIPSSNTSPTLGGTFTTAGAVNDNSTTTPFSNITVTDADGDNVSIAITFTAANGTLFGTGLTGSSGVYEITATTATIAQTNLQALVFTPTENQVSPTSTIVTTFTLTPNDGTVDGTSNATTEITATSVNDAPTAISLTGSTIAQSTGTNGVIATLGSTDADTGDAVTYSLVAGTGDTDNASFNIDGTDLRANDASSLDAGTYSILLQVNDGDASYTEVFSITVTDDVAPTLTTLSPADNATAISSTSDLVITLSENVVKGTGNILIKKTSDDSTVESIDVTSALVTIVDSVVTINPSNALDLNTEYYVQIPATALKDAANNAYAGITDTTSWSFTTVANTAPTASNINFSGTLREGQTLTGNYTYADKENDVETGSTFKWYRSNDSSGTGKIAITGASSQTYLLSSTDVAKFISFEVTPKNAEGTGLAVQSSINSTAVSKKIIAIVVPYQENGNDVNTSVLFDENLGDVEINENEAVINVGGNVVNLGVQSNGEANGSLTLADGTVSRVNINHTQTQTSVDENGNVKTIATINDEASIETNLNADGTVSHRVTYRGVTTEATSSIKGASISIDENGSVETTSEVEKDGFIYKAIVRTDASGKTTTKFIKINVATGKTEDLSNTLKDGTSFESGNNPEVVKLNDLIFIKISTTLNDSILVIE